MTAFFKAGFRRCAAAGLILPLLAGLASVLPMAPGIAATSSLVPGVPARKAISADDIERARNYFTDTVMTTHDGRKVRFYSDMLDDRVVVLNVIYTNCEGACPLQTQMLSSVSNEIGDLFGSKVHFVSVTNDAERDTPAALTEFERKQNVNLAGWTFLTGVKADVDRVISKIGLYTPNFQQHKSMILLGNTRTGHWQKVAPNVPPQAIAAKIMELASEE